MSADRQLADADTPRFKWFDGGDGHGYAYQYIGPIHYLCECGDYFLSRDRWMFHKGAMSAEAAVAAALALADRADARADVDRRLVTTTALRAALKTGRANRERRP